MPPFKEVLTNLLGSVTKDVKVFSDSLPLEADKHTCRKSVLLTQTMCPAKNPIQNVDFANIRWKPLIVAFEAHYFCPSTQLHVFPQ